MTYAIASDVAGELGRPVASFTPEELEQITRWLRRAERTILGRIPDLAARIASGDLTEELVADIEAAAVARKALNPEGKQNERIDDYSYGRVDEAATVDIVITDAEWAMLMPVRSSGAFTIRPTWGG